MTIEEAERIVSHPGWKARRIGVDCARHLQRLLFPAASAKPGPQRALIGRLNHTSSLRHAASNQTAIAADCAPATRTSYSNRAQSATVVALEPSHQRQGFCPEEKDYHEASFGLYRPFHRRRPPIRPTTPAPTPAGNQARDRCPTKPAGSPAR